MNDYLRPYIDLNLAENAPIIDETSYWGAKFADLFFEHLDLLPNLTVLDLATGTGVPLFELAYRFGASCTFVGVDMWRAGLQHANYKRGLYQLDNISLIESDGEELPFADMSFDLIVSNVGINNFSNIDAVLSECYRIAKPNSRLALTTNLVGHMQEFYVVFRQVLEKLGSTDSLERLESNIAHRGTKTEHIAHIENAGFKIQKALEQTLTWRYLDGQTMLRHSLTRFGFLDAWRTVIGSHNEKAIFAELEKRLNDIASKEAQLILTIPQLYLEARRI